MFIEPNQDWGNIKLHFGKAYENMLISGRGVNAPGTLANTQALSDYEDNRITTTTDVMITMQMASTRLDRYSALDILLLVKFEFLLVT